MANTITNVLPKLLAQGLRALRENAILPQLVNKSYDTLAQQKGNVINIPIPSSVAARAVTPAVTYAANVDSNPTVAQVTLDRWMEAPFQMSDNDMLSVMEDTMPMQASEAIKALGNDIDAYILSKSTGFYNISGTTGTAPFTTLSVAASVARKQLNKSIAPVDDRYGVIDPDAEGNLLLNSEILKFNERGDAGGIVGGGVGRKLGIDWYMDQNLTANTHTNGSALSTATATFLFNGTNAVGAKSISVIATTSGTILIGDIFGVATGVTGFYVVTANATMVSSTTLVLSIYPGLRQAYASGATITLATVGTSTISEVYVPNLVFHRDAFAFASRPLASIAANGNTIQSQVDPVTGIALRLEVSRQYKQTTFSYDVLYGCNVVRPEYGAIVRG
jgi:hypothetical protein